MNWFLKLIGGGVLDRILDTVDQKVTAETERDRIKGDIIQTHLKTRAGFMEAGGLVLMLLWAVPAAFHFAAVAVYSVFWCADCAFPQEWTIAALPAREANWAGFIVLSVFGVVGIKQFNK